MVNEEDGGANVDTLKKVKERMDVREQRLRMKDVNENH